MDYHVGDTVIHRNYGLGEIVKMDDKLIHERQTRCYVVRIRDLTIWVSADEPSSSTIRLPTAEAEFQKLFEILQSEAEPLPDDRYERKLLLSSRLKDGQLTSICSVIRDLVVHRRGKKLNDADKSTLEYATNLLITEWMFSLSVPLADASRELNLLLGV